MSAILTELVECFAFLTQPITSSGIENLLPSSRSTAITVRPSVTYGSANDSNYEKLDDDKVEYIYEEYSTDDTSKPPLLRRLLRSIWTSFVITLLVGVFPLGVTATVLVYLNLNTSNLCSKWIDQVDKLPKDVMGLKFIADVLETMVINLWFPFTLCILFRLAVFKKKFMKALTGCLVVGLMTVLYKSILFVSLLYQRKPYYNFPSNVLFATGVAYGSYVVAEKIRKEEIQVSRTAIMVKLSIQFALGGMATWIFGYVIVPWFNNLHNEKGKIIAATLFTPSIILLPKAISLYFAEKAVFGLTCNYPERSFILAWYPHGVAIIVFRTMQSDLKGFKAFVALCFFNGVVNVIMKLTEKLRQDIRIYFLRILRKVFCRESLQVTPQNLPLKRRLIADISIQTMLCETTSLIICQAYRALYIITNFHVSPWPVFHDFICRISVALAVDLFFNCLSIFIQSNWHNVPIPRVWREHWKVHNAVSFITILMTIMYFSPILLTVVQTYADNNSNLHAKNCSLPFNL